MAWWCELIGELVLELQGASWWAAVDVKGIGDDGRRCVLQRVKDKLGFNRAVEALGIARGSLHNYLHGVRRVPDEVLRRALQYLDEVEFREVVGGLDRLRATGILREDGSVDYSLILQAVALASRDEYLKQAILRFAVEHFREDLKKMLGIVPLSVKLSWERGFEEFLREHKKRGKVTNPETLRYYKSLFERYLEGKNLSKELVDYVINHPNKWVRNVFRHYIRYLYYVRRISPEAYGWIMEVVPSRSYKLDVRPYPIDLQEVGETLRYLRGNHELYYLIYRLMLEGGLRLSHALTLIKSFKPDEVVEVNGLDVDTKRLVCFEEKGFCRYYLGIKGGVKPCEWAYFSIETVKVLKKYVGYNVSRWCIQKYANRRKLLAPKYMRKVAWRFMIQIMPKEVARFLQSRFGELKISESRYEDLLAEADEYYPKYLERLKLLEFSATSLSPPQSLNRSVGVGVDALSVDPLTR
jgi:intergrase/recombinase